MKNISNYPNQFAKTISLIFVALLTTAIAYGQTGNTWTQKANFGGVAGSGSVGFSIGSKGYIGTGGAFNGLKKDFWEYDPSTNVWTQKADFGGVARVWAVGFSISNKGYIGTGSDLNGNTKDFWEYDPTSNTWMQKTDFGGTARKYSVGLSIGSKGYIGPGLDINGNTNDFWEYDPSTNAWTQKANFGGTARNSEFGFSIGSKGYIGTGVSGNYPYVFHNDFWEYDPSTDTWIQKSNFPGTVRDGAVGFSIGGKGYIGTGQACFGGCFLKDFWEYDPSADAWIQKTDFGGASRYTAVGFSIGSKGYIGTGYNGSDYNDFWEYTPDCFLDVTVYADADADGYGNPSSSTTNPTCDLLSGYVLNNTDCNDANALVHTNQSETTGDGIDNNCNGVVDENNALNFDGVNDYVNIPNESNFDFTTAMTVEAWINITAFTNSFQAIVTKGDDSWRLQGTYNTNSLDFATTALSNQDLQATIDVTGGVWHHIAAVYDGTTKYLYIDGDIAASAAATGTIANSSYNVAIGQNLQFTSRQWNGKIDEVRIWNIARTPSEIQTDMLGTTCGGQSGLVAYYTFNQGIASGTNTSETSLDDLTSNNNDGSLINFALTGSASNWVTGVPGLTDSATFYQDADGDTYGNANVSISALACSPPAGYVWDNTDCNDANAFVHPDAEEVINCADDNCNGIIDEGKWIQKTNFGGVARYNAAGFVISGKVYIGTGKDASNVYKKDFWQYDPATNVWTQKADFGGSKRYKAAGFAIGTKGYIGTGYDLNGSLVKTFWGYDIATNAWTQKAAFGGTGRQNAVGFSIGSKGYIGTGGNFLTQHNDFWEYDPATDTWTQKANVGDTLREAATGFSIGSKGYIGTGSNSSGNKNDFWEYDPATDTWTQKADFAGTARQAATGFSINDKGYIGTGYDGTYKNDFWQYDPATDTWKQNEDFPGLVRAYAVGFSVSGKGYIGTGGGGAGSAYNDFYEYVAPVFVGLTLYADADNDGFGDAGNSYVTADCVLPNGYVTDSTDCDDTNAAVNPAALEICDGIDNNCDGIIDPLLTFYADADGDSYGDNTISIVACLAPAGYVADSTDCDDTNPDVKPGGVEVCNGADDNCDGNVDEGLLLTFYADADGDTYGDASSSMLACSQPNNYVTDNTDCDDNNAIVNPSITEVCNSVDDNCNGSIDEGLLIAFYADADGDNYGNAGNSILACSQPNNYVTDNTDCDDNNATVNPSITELCNSVDDNCNGSIDEGLLTAFYADADGDNFGNAGNSILACSQPSSYVTDNTDCDDNDALVHPGATETCNDIDDNCINGIDEGLVFLIYYQDADGDGYGNQLVSDSSCNGAPAGFVTDNKDCDDSNPNVYPDAPEIINNGIDDNCNGMIDEFGVGIHDPNAPGNFSIYPNPAEDYATIQFTLAQSSHVCIKVYEISGKEIGALLNDNLEQGEPACTEVSAGRYSLLFNTNHFSKGVYLVKMISDFGIENQKFIVQ